MRILRSLLIAALVLGAAGFIAGSPQAARADGSFHVGFGTGAHFGHGHFGHGHFGPGHFGHRHFGYFGGYYRPWYGPYYPRYPLWGPVYRPWYQPPPRTVYVVPPQPAPQVVVQPPPVVQQAPALAYDTSYCREYSRTAVVNGAPVEVFGTACRQPDGTWRIVN